MAGPSSPAGPLLGRLTAAKAFSQKKSFSRRELALAFGAGLMAAIMLSSVRWSSIGELMAEPPPPGPYTMGPRSPRPLCMERLAAKLEFNRLLVPSVNGLTANDTDVTEEFQAIPWMLPPRTTALPYAGVHDFDRLLEVQARPVGEYERAVTLLLFSREWATMAQNSIYSLIKHGGTRNFVVVTWTSEDLEACADLNLPCADARRLVAEGGADGGQKEGGKAAKDAAAKAFLSMAWIKPALLRRALEQGYAVMLADADVAYTVKPLWASYAAFIQGADADGAFMEGRAPGQDKPALSTGQFALLPTPAAVAFAKAWAEQAPKALEGGKSDQQGLTQLEGSAFQCCDNICRCMRTGYNMDEGKRNEVALLRTYLPSHHAYSANWCTAGSPDWIPRIDSCDWNVLYLHPTCVSTLEEKRAVLQAAGLWFMDDTVSEEDPEIGGCRPQLGAPSGVAACPPLHWRFPDLEVPLYSCKGHWGLGLVHGGEPLGVARVRAMNLTRAELEVLFDSKNGRLC